MPYSTSGRIGTAVKPKFRVAICGGGIAGLTLAIALQKYPDIRVDVYEAAESFKEIGAGVMVWGRAWTILRELGLAQSMRESEGFPVDGSSDPMFAFDYRKSDQPTEGYMWRAVRLPYICFLLHRAHFLSLLAARVLAPDTNTTVHFNKRLLTYHRSRLVTFSPHISRLDSSSELRLSFDDGTSSVCDVLLGCDGIKSVVRRCMYEELARAQGRPELVKYAEPYFSGTIAYRTLVPVETLTRNYGGKEHPAMRDAKMYCGTGQHIVSYGIAAGTMCNINAMVTKRETEGTEYTEPWDTECDASELRALYTGWEPEVEALLKGVDRVTKWAVHQLHPLPFYTHNRVAVLGDAAHAMTPHQGAGAGQAIEDAYILAGLLGHPRTTHTTLQRALAAYERVRQPMAQHVTDGSRISGMMHQLQSPHGDAYEQLGPAIERQWDWVSGSDPQAELQRALRLCYPEEYAMGKL